MDLFAASRSIFRSSQPLLRRPRRISSIYNPQPFRCQPARPFTSTHATHQQPARAPFKEDEETTNTTTAADDFNAILDGALEASKGTPTASTSRTSRFKTPSAQESSSPSRQLAESQKRSAAENEDFGGSMDEIFSAIITPRPELHSSAPPGRSNIVSEFGDILDLRGPSTSPARGPPPPSAPQTAPMRLNSSTGRTIQVDSLRGMDVARAFRSLEIQCARNSVRRDFQRQRFHERPGLKRKRLKSERWRRRFRENFKGTIAMVQRLKAQGW